MKRFVSFSVVMALIGLAGTQPLEAQRKGMGGILDWINELSGPRMVGPALTAWYSFDDPPSLDTPGEDALREERSGDTSLVLPTQVLSVGSARNRIHGSIAYRLSSTSDDAIAEAGERIEMLSGQVMYERVVVQRRLEVGLAAGLGLHRFGGDVDTFYHWSIMPIYAQLRFPTTSRVRVVGGFGFHYFFKFDTTDFQPLTVDVSRTSGEWTPSFGLGLEIVWP